MDKDFLNNKEARELTGFSESTLKRYAENGLIFSTKTKGGCRRYGKESIKDFLNNKDNKNKYKIINHDISINICEDNKNFMDPSKKNKKYTKYAYAFINPECPSTLLQDQIYFYQKRYPYYNILTDINPADNYIGSNFEKIIKEANDGKVISLILFLPDRLTLLFNVIKGVVEKSGGKIITINDRSQNEEEIITINDRSQSEEEIITINDRSQNEKIKKYVYILVDPKNPYGDIQERVEYFEKKYSGYIVLLDNEPIKIFKDSFLYKILRESHNGVKISLVLVNKEKLTEHGFKSLESDIKSSGGEIIIDDGNS